MATFPAHRRDPGPVPPGTATARPEGAGSTLLAVVPSTTKAPKAPTTTTTATTPRATPGTAPAAAPPARPPRLRVTVTCFAPDGVRRQRTDLDTDQLPPDDGHRLHALVDAVEAAGPPAGATFGLVQRPAGATPTYEVTAARGFGHWTVTVPVGVHSTTLAALIDHVRGAPRGS